MVNYAAIAMMGSDMPNNYGLARAIECRFRDGSVICPTFPAPVGFYSMTMPVVEDVVFEALSKVSGNPAVAHNSVSGMVVLGTSGPAGEALRAVRDHRLRQRRLRRRRRLDGHRTLLDRRREVHRRRDHRV